MRWFTHGFLVATATMVHATNAPPIRWQQSHGGTNDEFLTSVAQLRDGSFILSGYSFSEVGGNKTAGGGSLGWLVFADPMGNKTGEWSITDTNGGINNRVIATADGGFLLTLKGFYREGAGKTLKYRADRTVQWQFPLGGHTRPCADGGFILLSSTTSNAVLKRLNAAGVEQWTGLVTNTTAGTDARDVIQTADGGYASVFRERDFSFSALVVRWDANGNEVWRRALIGTYDQEPFALRQLPDGGLVFAGYTLNPLQPGGGFNYADGWVARLNSAGGVISETRYGAGHWDEFHTLEVLADGGLLLAGISFSEPYGAKQSPHIGDRDYWVLRLDAAGNRMWDASFGGTTLSNGGRNDLSAILLTRQGGILLAGNSDSQPSGNKTSLNFGGRDYWVLHLGQIVPLTTSLSGSDLRIHFHAMAGSSYVLQARNGFESTTWTALGPVLTASANGPAFFSLPRTNTHRFFRVGMD
jgi:hypothetical protein